MKKIIIYSLLIFLFFLTGCSSFLEEHPEDRLVVSNFYTNSTDAEAAVDAVYSELYSIYERNMFLLCDLPADTHKNGRGMPNTYLQALEFLRYDASNTFIRDVWEEHYQGISRANTAITKLSNIDITDSVKNRYIGEAKFLRALYYFNLVRFFGDVPLVLSSENVSDAVGPRIDKEKIYAQIISDLQNAISNLPISYNSTNQGRATKGAAQILLGKVYLTKGDNKDAKEVLSEVISNESEYGYGLFDNYADVWNPTTETGKEAVFYIEYQPAPLQYNQEMSLIGPKYSISKSVGVSASYEADIPTEELYDAFQDGDQRKDVTLRKIYVNPVNGDTVTSSIPLFAKYWQDGLSDPTKCEINFHIIRYSDAILTYAEALNNLGETTEALKQLNRVVERAYKGNASRDYTSLSQSEILDAILHERWLEFPLEGQRWFDLVRTGKFVERMKAHSAYEATHAEANKTQLADNIKDYMILMPIPQHEIDINSQLTQNPGWGE